LNGVPSAQADASGLNPRAEGHSVRSADASGLNPLDHTRCALALTRERLCVVSALRSRPAPRLFAGFTLWTCGPISRGSFRSRSMALRGLHALDAQSDLARVLPLPFHGSSRISRSGRAARSRAGPSAPVPWLFRPSLGRPQALAKPEHHATRLLSAKTPKLQPSDNASWIRAEAFCKGPGAPTHSADTWPAADTEEPKSCRQFVTALREVFLRG